jgi:hypothetical protein
MIKGITCMTLVLSKIQKVEERAHSFNYVGRIMPTRNRKIDDKPKKHAAHFLVLMARNPRKSGYPLCEEQDVVIWGHSPALRVNLPWPKDPDQPFDKVLHDALKHLMKNVGRNRKEYVGKWESFPERMVDWFQSGFTTSQVKCVDIAVSQSICFNCCIAITGREGMVFAKLSAGNTTFGAPAIVCAGYEGLLRVIADENGKDRVASAPDTSGLQGRA